MTAAVNVTSLIMKQDTSCLFLFFYIIIFFPSGSSNYALGRMLLFGEPALLVACHYVLVFLSAQAAFVLASFALTPPAETIFIQHFSP